MLIKVTKTIEVDDKIANNIIELTNKGYPTDFCCSGHIDNDKVPYVLFSTQVTNKIKTCPHNWSICTVGGKINIWRRFTENEKEIFTKEQLIDIAMMELKNWIILLRDNSKKLYDIDLKAEQVNE